MNHDLSGILASRRGLLLAAASLATGCASPPPAATPMGQVPAPQVRLGQRWRYEKLDQFKNVSLGRVSMEVVALSPGLRVRVSDDSGKTLGEELYDSPWLQTQEPGDDGAQVFAQPVPLLPQPLALGAAQRLETTYRVNGEGVGLFYSQRLQATRWERVRVPAGEFDTLRVNRQIVFRNHLSQQTLRDDVLWYAPQVNRWVKRSWSGYRYGVAVRLGMMADDRIGWQLIDYAPGG